jgi:putative zinc finger protein
VRAVPERGSTLGGDPELVIACREFVELVTEHLEGALPEEFEKAIAAHLELCDPCVAYLEQVRTTVRLLGTLPVASLPRAARARLLDVYASLHPQGPGSERGPGRE